MPNEIAPSASEILNFRVDPELGGGVPVPLLKENSAIDQLNANARFVAQNKINKYKEFLDNLKGIYKDLNDISGMDTYTPDKPYLQKQAQDIYSSLKNPRDLYSPEVQGRIAKLRSEATESKLNRVYDYAHREFLARNPELNTEENKNKFQQFSSQPLGKREPFTLDMPPVFDPTTLANDIIKEKDVAIPFAASGATPDNSMINEVAGTKFLRDEFLKKWDAALAYKQDNYGKPIRAWAEEQFNNLTPQQKQAFGGTVEDFWKKLGEEKFGAANDVQHITKDELKPNANFLKSENLALDVQKANETARHNKAMEGIDWSKYDLDKQKFTETTKGEEESKNASVAFANGLFGDLLSKGSIKTANGGAVLTPDDVRKLTADQLKFLGKELPPQRDENPNSGTYGQIIQSGGLQPLKLNDDEVLQVNPDGTVLIMQGAKYHPESKRFTGKWDNNRSTSIWNAARNVLNEENVKAGSKERNAYLPIDLRNAKGEIQVDVSGGGKTTTTNVDKSTGLSLEKKDWKKEGNNWRYMPTGQLYDSAGKVIQKKSISDYHKK